MVFKGRYMLGNKFQQHVVATHRWEKLLCVCWRNYCENLCLLNKSHKIKSLICAVKRFCCWDKDNFQKNSPVHMKWFVAVMFISEGRVNMPSLETSRVFLVLVCFSSNLKLQIIIVLFITLCNLLQHNYCHVSCTHWVICCCDLLQGHVA